ncbi:hypothetical protein KP509_17G024900 [Ceratopteris richardii]|uniref:Cyclin n=1 Tax=Ceratopteris richardii TaxID=49495 RepID=A0A8T2STK5_CERRI|nr:hypothetical protein KP509_17G024900 [Ceratopteris richardii]
MCVCLRDMDALVGTRSTRNLRALELLSCSFKGVTCKSVDTHQFGLGGSLWTIPRVLQVLWSLLQRIVAMNDAYSAYAGRHNAFSHLDGAAIFQGLKAPSISLQHYVERIFKYADCSPSCFVVAYVYLDRFIHQQPGLPITSLNVHRLLITSVMVAAKFLDDAYYSNAYYAKVGGVSTCEMNRLELEFLFRLSFRLQVPLPVFESYCSYMEKEVAAYLVDGTVDRPLPFLTERKEYTYGKFSKQTDVKMSTQSTTVSCVD